MHAGNLSDADHLLTSLVDLGELGGEDLRWTASFQLGVSTLLKGDDASSVGGALTHFRKSVCFDSKIAPVLYGSTSEVDGFFYDREIEVIPKFDDVV